MLFSFWVVLYFSVFFTVFSELFWFSRARGPRKKPRGVPQKTNYRYLPVYPVLPPIFAAEPWHRDLQVAEDRGGRHDMPAVGREALLERDFLGDGKKTSNKADVE